MTDGSSVNVLSRRRLLRLGGGVAVVAAAAACSANGGGGGSGEIGPGSDDVEAYAAELRRRFPRGRTVAQTLTAAPEQLDVGGTTSSGWVYNGQLTGPTIRANVGDRLQVLVRNHLPEPTSVHWHGLALRNDMDGVIDVTQRAIAPGKEFRYEFVPPNPGTYWYHSHGELQRGRGLYGALIVDDPRERGDYDVELTVVLSDWLQRRTPRQVFDSLRGGMTMDGDGHGMSGMGERSSPVLGGDAGDVDYPVHLLNGKPPNDPATFTAKPGRRARIRVINAAEDTAYRVAIGGHRIDVTHTDGFPVTPVTGDAVLIGQGERYDLTATLRDGVFPLVAAAEGKGNAAFGLVRTSSGTAPDPSTRPPQLRGRLLTVADLRSTPADRLPAKKPETTVEAKIAGSMGRYDWSINGKRYPKHAPLVVHPGQRTRLVYTNTTKMYHPMHLHGHTFAVARPDGTGPRKDTVIVLPGQTVAADFDADNPGQWFTHCHNEYHLAAGLATVVSYRR